MFYGDQTLHHLGQTVISAMDYMLADGGVTRCSVRLTVANCADE